MTSNRIIVGSDHAGLAMKRELVKAMADWRWEVEDIGTLTTDSVDYPEYALEVARRVAGGEPPLGLLVCGSGIGMSIAASKIRGVRAALCHDPYSARMARAHNDANVLCIGGRVIGPELAKAVLRAFLDGRFEGGRHQRRLDLIAAAEARGDGAE